MNQNHEKIGNIIRSNNTRKDNKQNSSKSIVEDGYQGSAITFDVGALNGPTVAMSHLLKRKIQKLDHMLEKKKTTCNNYIPLD